MATLEELKADIQSAKDAIVAEKAEVAAKLQALKDQIAAGTAVTQADLDDLDVSVKEIAAGVSDITVPDSSVT